MLLAALLLASAAAAAPANAATQGLPATANTATQGLPATANATAGAQALPATVPTNATAGTALPAAAAVNASLASALPLPAGVARWPPQPQPSPTILVGAFPSDSRSVRLTVRPPHLPNGAVPRCGAAVLLCCGAAVVHVRGSCARSSQGGCCARSSSAGSEASWGRPVLAAAVHTHPRRHARPPSPPLRSPWGRPTCWLSLATRAQVEAAARARGRAAAWPQCAREWQGAVPGARVMALPRDNITYPFTKLHFPNVLAPNTSYVAAVGCRLPRHPETVSQLRFRTGPP